MAWELAVSQAERTAVLQLRGELDGSGLTELRQWLTSLGAQGSRRVVVDLDRASASEDGQADALVRTLVEWVGLNARSELSVARASASVRALLEVSAPPQVIPLYATVEEAIEPAVRAEQSLSRTRSTSQPRLDQEEVLASVASLAVPRVADWASVSLVEPGGSLRRLALAHSNPSRLADVNELLGRLPFDLEAAVGAARVLRTGEPDLVAEFTDELLATVVPDPQQRDLARALGLVSLLSVPMVARDTVVGVLSVATTAASGRRYSVADIELVAQLARIAAMVVDNDRLFQEVDDAQHRYRSLVQTVDAIVWEAEGRTFRLSFISDRVLSILGFTPEQMVGEDAVREQVVHPDDLGRVQALFTQAVTDSKPLDFVYRAVAADGRTVWLRNIVQPVRGPSGTVEWLRGLAVDVTTQTEIERRQEALYDLGSVLADASGLGPAAPRIVEVLCRALGWQAGALWVVDSVADRTTCLDFWSQPARPCRTLRAASRDTRFGAGTGLPGRARAEGSIVWIADLSQEPDLPRASAALADGLRSALAVPIMSGAAVVGVLELFSTEATAFEPALRRVLSSAGSQIGQFIERRRAEDELRFRQTLLEAESEADIDGNVVIGPRGEVSTWNQRFVELTGVPEALLASGCSGAALIDAIGARLTDPASFVERTERALRGDRRVRETVVLLNGRILDWYSTPLLSRSGDDFGSVFSFRDVTRERRIGAALTDANRRLRVVASTLQRSFLPPEPPHVPGVEVAGRFRPAGEGIELGGDFYDVFETARNDWAFVVGDVCGKGPEAAAVTALARHTLRAAAIAARKPRVVLGLLNEALLRDQPEGRFCTVAYARLRRTPAGARLTTAAGGHPLPLVLRTTGHVTALGRPGTLLGVVPDVQIVDAKANLRPGDTVLLFTDGVTEAAAPDGTLFGEGRLRSVLGGCAGLSPDEVVVRLERAIVEFESGRQPRDDLALLALRITTGLRQHRGSLAAAAEAPADA